MVGDKLKARSALFAPSAITPSLTPARQQSMNVIDAGQRPNRLSMQSISKGHGWGRCWRPAWAASNKESGGCEFPGMPAHSETSSCSSLLTLTDAPLSLSASSTTYVQSAFSDTHHHDTLGWAGMKFRVVRPGKEVAMVSGSEPDALNAPKKRS